MNFRHPPYRMVDEVASYYFVKGIRQLRLRRTFPGHGPAVYRDSALREWGRCDPSLSESKYTPASSNCANPARASTTSDSTCRSRASRLSGTALTCSE